MQARYYRLDAGNLAPGYQISAGFHAGDLLLRPDHTYTRAFGHFIAGNAFTTARVEVGTWQQNGTALTVQPTGTESVVGTVTTDSVRLLNADGSTGARYLRADLTGTALSAGTWVLRSINGAGASDTSGIVSYGAPFEGGHYVARVRSDTLVFTDGLFVHDAWAGTTYFVPAYGVPTTAAYGYEMSGVYDATATQVRIQYMSANPHNSANETGDSDVLTVQGDTLVRTLALPTGPLVQRYVRVR